MKMTKKTFLSIKMMLLFVLAMSINTAWANHLTSMTDEEAETAGFWARLTAKSATTTNGSGKVFVSENYHSVTPLDEDYLSSHSVDGWSDVYAQTSIIDGDVMFSTYAKADPGSYFVGWSFTDGSTDLGNQASEFSVKVTPTSKKGHANIKEYTIYAAFEPIRFVSYTKTDLTVSFEMDYEVGLEDFETPSVTGKNGTWTILTSGKKKLNASGYTLTVPLKLEEKANPGEYAAVLTVTTKAGLTMRVPVYYRVEDPAPGNAALYDGKTLKEPGTVAEMLAVNTETYTNPILKLSGDCAETIEVNKDLTLDLNGYTLNNALTVNGGNVTLAYSPYGGTVTGTVTVAGGKLTLNGGSLAGSVTVNAGAELVLNGAEITGTITNKGTLTTTDGKCLNTVSSIGTLSVNGGFFYNQDDSDQPAIIVSGGTANINRCTIGDEASVGVGNYGIKVTSGATATIGKYAAINAYTAALWNDGGSITVNGGKFDRLSLLNEGAITFNSAYFKYYDKDDDTEVAAAAALGKQIWRNTAGPEAREGYAFFAGDQAAAQASNVSVCRIGMASYRSLEEALAYANNSGKDVIIIMENDYTLPAGYYTLPANATLIVPMSDDQEVDNPIVPRNTSEFPPAVSFRKLTFESGVNMTVLGTIELSCTQYGQQPKMGVPGGNYGHLILKPGSHVTLNNGGELRAWGYVTGDGTRDGEGNYLSGEIDARRGSIVREQFQMGDWKGGDISFSMAMEIPGMNPTWRDLTHLFPVYTYFIQNVESPVKYHPGSSLICATSVNVAGNINAYADNIKVVGKEGEAAMFLMNENADAENTWVRKFYDVKNDKQVYEVNSGAQLGSVVIELGKIPGSYFGASGTLDLMLDSRNFVLPLTNNFKIHLLSGNMEFTQSTSCLPGMEVEIDKESVVSIVKLGNENVVEGALYLYDADQWSMDGDRGYVGNEAKFGAIVTYSATLDAQPTARDISSPAAIGDAKLNVHGTFRMAEGCSVYTSWTKDMSTMGLNNESGTGGASIISTNADAGTFIFDANAPAFDGVQMDGEGNLTGIGTSVLVNYDHNDYGMGTQYPMQIKTVLNKKERVYGFELFTPAKLKNKDGTFVETEETPAHTSYCYIGNQWTTMQVAEDDCFMKEVVGGETTYYAKPAEYVAVNATWDGTKMVGNTDHTFSDKAGTGRLFILIKQDCQWWEVEKKDNLYHCTNNDTYYYWDDSNADSKKHKWVEKRFTITWQNWDGTEIKSYINTGGEDDEEVEYSVTYGTMAEYLGTNPTREPTIDYTYDFTGWSPALGKVTSDVTYTATYNEQPRKYTIIFRQEGGVEIERQFLTHNEMPACENVPTRTGFTLEWSPAIAAVTGDATYTATWLEEPPTEYAITFYDYDGVTKLKPTDETPYMVAVGATPEAPADPTGKADWAETEGNKEFTYVFDHWSPAIIEKVSATSAKSYVAVYSEVAKTYKIEYYKEDGSTLISTESLPYGATPTPPAVSKENPAANTTYTLVWKTLNEESSIQTVMGDAKYKPTYTRELNRYTRYTVTLSANIPAGVTLIGAGSYDEGESVTIQAIPAEGYEFVQWNDGEENEERVITIEPTETGNTFIAEVRATAVAEDLEITATGSVTLDAPATKHDLVITSDGATSGELIGANYLTLTGDAYFDLEMEMDALTWYAVAVPWEVDATKGIIVNGSPLRLVTDIDVLYYDGESRAANGTGAGISNWKYVADLGDKTLNPGTLYMIYLANPTSSIRFKKKAGASISTTELSVQQHTSQTGSDIDAGWNGIANPALYHAFINAGASTVVPGEDDTQHPNYAQKYVPGVDRYESFVMTTKPLIVGEPVFVQVATSNTISAYETKSGAGYAPRRAPRVDNAYYEVQISAGEAYTDRLYLQTLEDKEDRYVIGLDLAKAGVSTKVAQMWVNRYNAKLCVNTTAPVGKTATYPLGISVPENGTYQISSATEMQANQELYVTRNGNAIWNLAYGPYTVTLDKGTYSEYGIKLIQSNAPAVTTGVDQTTTDKLQIQKVLIDNKVYIVREGELYTITGQKIN